MSPKAEQSRSGTLELWPALQKLIPTVEHLWGPRYRPHDVWMADLWLLVLINCSNKLLAALFHSFLQEADQLAGECKPVRVQIMIFMMRV
jgi:hypothetical protein